MKKRMKLFWMLLVFALVIPLFNSCEDDDDDTISDIVGSYKLEKMMLGEIDMRTLIVGMGGTVADYDKSLLLYSATINADNTAVIIMPKSEGEGLETNNLKWSKNIDGTFTFKNADQSSNDGDASGKIDSKYLIVSFTQSLGLQSLYWVKK